MPTPQDVVDFVLQQRGMFSYSGLSKEQVRRLRDEFSIYTIDTGRRKITFRSTNQLLSRTELDVRAGDRVGYQLGPQGAYAGLVGITPELVAKFRFG